MFSTIVGDNPVIKRTERTGYPTEEPEAVYECCCCEEGIYEGDAYYEIDGKNYCEDCMKDTFQLLA